VIGHLHFVNIGSGKYINQLNCLFCFVHVCQSSTVILVFNYI